MGLRLAPSTESVMGSLPTADAGVGFGHQRHVDADRRCTGRGRPRNGPQYPLPGLHDTAPRAPADPAEYREAHPGVARGRPGRGRAHPGKAGDALAEAARRGFVSGMDLGFSLRRWSWLWPAWSFWWHFPAGPVKGVSL